MTEVLNEGLHINAFVILFVISIQTSAHVPLVIIIIATDFQQKHELVRNAAWGVFALSLLITDLLYSAIRIFCAI